MNTPILIAFGSNIDPQHHLPSGLSRLATFTGLCAVSTVYRTQAIPDPDRPVPPAIRDPDFLNGALLIQEAWDPLELQRLLKQIERDEGRQPNAPRWAPRPLDLDIVLMGNRIWHSPTLTLPDPDLCTRAYLAISVAQLAPDWQHPVLQVSLATIASRFTPSSREMTPDPATTACLQAMIPARFPL